MKAPDISKVVKQIDDYLAVLRLSGNYRERQRIGLTNQQLPAFIDQSRAAVLSAVVKGALAEAFIAQWEEEWPTHGKPLPERFAEFVKEAAGKVAT